MKPYFLRASSSYCIDRAKNATISIPIEVSHFGRAPLQSVRIHWQLEQQPVTEYTYGEHGKTLTQTYFSRLFFAEH